jgi:YbbR domain-containing protein
MHGIARVFQETLQFFASLVRIAARSLGENRGLAVLSIVLAFGLWIYVTDSENPTRTRVLPIDIPVEAINVPDDVAIADDIAPVRVRVTVADEVFDSLSATDFEATVDLDGLGVGSYEGLPVEVEPLTSRGGLRIASVLPSTADVTLAPLIGKSVPVQIEVQGTPAPGYSMGTPIIDDDTVLVTGPQEEVDKVTQVTATVDVSGQTGDIDRAVRLTPRNDRGFLVQRVQLEPSITGVSIAIDQETFSRAVVVSVVTQGKPASGYNVSAVSVSPPTVTVRGSQSYITTATSISTRPIDIEGASETIVQTVSLDVPSGAEITGSGTTVTVTVTISAALSEFSFSVPVTAANLEGSVAISGALPSVSVTLVGPYDILSQVSPVDISATISLDGLTAGTHDVQVEVRPLAGVVVAGVSPGSVSIVLESR